MKSHRLWSCSVLFSMRFQIHCIDAQQVIHWKDLKFVRHLEFRVGNFFRDLWKVHLLMDCSLGKEDVSRGEASRSQDFIRAGVVHPGKTVNPCWATPCIPKPELWIHQPQPGFWVWTTVTLCWRGLGSVVFPFSVCGWNLGKVPPLTVLPGSLGRRLGNRN